MNDDFFILAAILDFSKCSTMPEWHPMDSKSGHIVNHVYAKTFYAYYKSGYFASHPDCDFGYSGQNMIFSVKHILWKCYIIIIKIRTLSIQFLKMTKLCQFLCIMSHTRNRDVLYEMTFHFNEYHYMLCWSVCVDSNSIVFAYVDEHDWLQRTELIAVI